MTDLDDTHQTSTHLCVDFYSVGIPTAHRGSMNPLESGISSTQETKKTVIHVTDKFQDQKDSKSQVNPLRLTQPLEKGHG
jgi:hypothetical protein